MIVGELSYKHTRKGAKNKSKANYIMVVGDHHTDTQGMIPPNSKMYVDYCRIGCY
jgi:hypothetical protein